MLLGSVQDLWNLSAVDDVFYPFKNPLNTSNGLMRLLTPVCFSIQQVCRFSVEFIFSTHVEIVCLMKEWKNTLSEFETTLVSLLLQIKGLSYVIPFQHEDSLETSLMRVPIELEVSVGAQRKKCCRIKKGSANYQIRFLQMKMSNPTTVRPRTYLEFRLPS